MTVPYDALIASERAKDVAYNTVIAAIEAAARDTGITRKEIAEKIGRKPAAVSAWLSGPSNWTIETISHLLHAIGAEVEYNIVLDADRTPANEFISVTDSEPTRRVVHIRAESISARVGTSPAPSVTLVHKAKG